MSRNRQGFARRLLRFRLATLLAVVAILAAVCGLVGGKLYEKRREQAVVAELKQLQFWVYYDYCFDSNDAFKRLQDMHPPGPAWLRAIAGDDIFASPRVANLYDFRRAGRSVADQNARRRERIRLLKQLPTLKEVWLGWDEPVAYMQALPGVKVKPVGDGT